MTLALITAKQVIVLFILIFSGFICVKTGAVKIEGRKAFSDLLVYFVVPCMIINSYLTEFDDNIFKNILIRIGIKHTAFSCWICHNIFIIIFRLRKIMCLS